jgi:hypothetical protein
MGRMTNWSGPDSANGDWLVVLRGLYFLQEVKINIANEKNTTMIVARFIKCGFKINNIVADRNYFKVLTTYMEILWMRFTRDRK